MNIIEEQGIKQICQNILDGKIEYLISEPINGTKTLYIKPSNIIKIKNHNN